MSLPKIKSTIYSNRKSIMFLHKGTGKIQNTVLILDLIKSRWNFLTEWTRELCTSWIPVTVRVKWIWTSFWNWQDCKQNKTATRPGVCITAGFAFLIFMFMFAGDHSQSSWFMLLTQNWMAFQLKSYFSGLFALSDINRILQLLVVLTVSMTHVHTNE